MNKTVRAIAEHAFLELPTHILSVHNFQDIVGSLVILLVPETLGFVAQGKGRQDLREDIKTRYVFFV